MVEYGKRHIAPRSYDQQLLSHPLGLAPAIWFRLNSSPKIKLTQIDHSTSYMCRLICRLRDFLATHLSLDGYLEPAPLRGAGC